METTGQQIFEFLSQHGYWIIVPLMIIEGPVVTVIAATMAALGAFNAFVVLGLSILGDVGGDIIWYGAGYFWGMSFVRKVGKYFGVTENLVLKMEKYFNNHGGKTIFAMKSTTGLCWATFTATGIVKMKFSKFLTYSILGGIIWSGFLVAMGYFYGYLWREISQYIEWIGWAIGGIVIVSFVGINLYKKHKAKKIFNNNNQAIVE
ncbi:MAG TPA: DedA family protein [Candidatus Moranbacteria bacterium]|nr:DedA family protein [Candidatus Moranbacteria bacterium]HDZ85250.1 DedA family protein [Candidatus Moranbacteria bacterium]